MEENLNMALGRTFILLAVVGDFELEDQFLFLQVGEFSSSEDIFSNK